MGSITDFLPSMPGKGSLLEDSKLEPTTTHKYDDGTNSVEQRTNYLNMNAGTWKNPDGSTSEGVGVEGGESKWSGKHLGRFFDLGWDAGRGTGGVNANRTTSADGTDDTYNIGFGGNAAEGSVTASSKSGDDAARFGLSAGEGFAKRDYFTDIDGDGEKDDRTGFGFDVGPVSVDIKSETAARAYADAEDEIEEVKEVARELDILPEEDSAADRVLDTVVDNAFGFNPVSAGKAIGKLF